MSKNLLVEIGLEEMPANVVSFASEQFREKTRKFLRENRLPFEKIESFSTPRRLAVRIIGLADAQTDMEEVFRGPNKKIALGANGEWSKAAVGFASGKGLSVDELIFKEVKGVEYVYVTKFEEGKSAIEVLTGLKAVIMSLTFPVSMTWADYDFHYIRPIRWLVALLDKEIVPFKILDIETSNKSCGHRLVDKKIILKNPSEYLTKLSEFDVIADSSKRKQMIVDQIETLAKENNWVVDLDEDLLEEVNNLVEYPSAFAGKFAEKYLSLPEEVLITSMKEHQRFFYVRENSFQLSSHFIAVRNGSAKFLENVIKGNQKVLVARLEDAEFFWKEDQKLKITDLVEKLKLVTFHEKIGTLYEHMKRTKRIAEILANQLNLAAKEKVALLRATDIYKFDLLTNMVDEFPELQGIMGEKYAILAGEEQPVAIAISEHYLPKSASGDLPESDVGAILAVADRLENLYSFFAVGLNPTGSNDPYALRRAALGVVRIIIEKSWNLSMLDLQEAIFKVASDEKNFYVGNQKVIDFLKNRLEQILQQMNLRHDLISAVRGSTSDNVVKMLACAQVLQNHASDENFKLVIESLTRVVNLAEKAEKIVKIDPDLFENDEEKELYSAFKNFESQSDFSAEGLYEKLVDLHKPIDAYFENTFVNAEDKAIKMNRYSQLKKLAQIILKFAAVNKIVVK